MEFWIMLGIGVVLWRLLARWQSSGHPPLLEAVDRVVLFPFTAAWWLIRLPWRLGRWVFRGIRGGVVRFGQWLRQHGLYVGLLVLEVGIFALDATLFLVFNALLAGGIVAGGLLWLLWRMSKVVLGFVFRHRDSLAQAGATGASLVVKPARVVKDSLGHKLERDLHLMRQELFQELDQLMGNLEPLVTKQLVRLPWSSEQYRFQTEHRLLCQRIADLKAQLTAEDWATLVNSQLKYADYETSVWYLYAQAQGLEQQLLSFLQSQTAASSPPTQED